MLKCGYYSFRDGLLIIALVMLIVWLFDGKLQPEPIAAASRWSSQV